MSVFSSEDEGSVNGKLENDIKVRHTRKRSNDQRMFDSIPPELLLQKLEKKALKNIMNKEVELELISLNIRK